MAPLSAREQFAGDVLVLSNTFGMKDRLDAIRISLYWEALKDIPAPILSQGAKRCMQACRYFPTIAEWRQACDEAEQENLFREEPPLVPQIAGDVAEEPMWEENRPAQYACEQCKDTGFVTWVCGVGARCHCTKDLCRQRPDDYQHRYVTKCMCRATNPVLARERDERRRRLRLSTYGRALKSGRDG